MKLIEKEKVVSEINKRLSICNKVALDLRNVENKDYYQGKAESYKETLDILNTLEAKEVDLENSMTCEVDWYDGFLLDYTQEQQDELLEKIGADVGDKIRVILMKE